MRSWDALPDAALSNPGRVTSAFIERNLSDYRSAARYLNHLPYGRNSSRTDTLAVVREGHGTCSTKHALLKELGIEQRIDVALVVGIYEMNESNTPGVGGVLSRHGLRYLPEAHCYLRYGSVRIDITRALENAPAEGIAHFLHEEDIAPAQVGEYKIALHREFLRQWLNEHREIAAVHDFEAIWRIREECIAVLSA